MNAVTNLLTIVSLLLALVAAENTTKDQVKASSTSAVRGTSSRPLPGGCDEFGCGTNHNETMVLDAEPMK